MAIQPVGIRKEMKTQMFREAQVAPPEQSSFYMQNGVSSPDIDSKKDEEFCDSIKDVRDFVVHTLINKIGVPQRIVDKKLENLVSYSINSAGEMSGFFIIPSHTGEKKISLDEARDIVSSFEKKFNCECDIEHGKNFKIKFKSISKSDPEPSNDDEGSLKFVPDEKNNHKKIASSYFAEQLEDRKNILYETLRRIGYGQ